MPVISRCNAPETSSKKPKPHVFLDRESQMTTGKILDDLPVKPRRLLDECQNTLSVSLQIIFALADIEHKGKVGVRQVRVIVPDNDRNSQSQVLPGFEWACFRQADPVQGERANGCRGPLHKRCGLLRAKLAVKRHIGGQRSTALPFQFFSSRPDDVNRQVRGFASELEEPVQPVPNVTGHPNEHQASHFGRRRLHRAELIPADAVGNDTRSRAILCKAPVTLEFICDWRHAADQLQQPGSGQDIVGKSCSQATVELGHIVRVDFQNGRVLPQEAHQPRKIKHKPNVHQVRRVLDKTGAQGGGRPRKHSKPVDKSFHGPDTQDFRTVPGGRLVGTTQAESTGRMPPFPPAIHLREDLLRHAATARKVIAEYVGDSHL